MIRTIRSGKVIEKSQFFVGERKPRGDRRKGSSTLKQIDRNLNDAVKRLARTINCNFAERDLFVTLTYDDEHMPDSPEQADKECSLFWRRLTRTMEKYCGEKPKGVWITADKDEKTGAPVRLHHHMVLSGDWFTVSMDGQTAQIDCRDLKDIWKNGYVNVEPLRSQDDYTSVAAYMVRQSVSTPDAKKWHPSRGLAKPVIESEVVIDRPHELRPAPGSSVQEISAYDIDTGSHYIRYIRRPRKKKIDGG